MRQLSYPTNIGNHVNSQSNFVFVNHNICDKPSSYYIFLLLECNSRCKTSPLPTSYFPQFQRWNSKVLIKEEKGIHNSWKTIFNRSFNNIFLENIHLHPPKLLVQDQQDLPSTENLFIRNYWDKKKKTKKSGKGMTILNSIRSHGYITNV